MARANCIAHQPPNMRFEAPADLRLKWSCVTAGPLYEHSRRWYLITFKVTNAGPKRTQALKMQANVIDAFGDVLATVPITENARLGNGDSDGADFAFHPPFPANGVGRWNHLARAGYSKNGQGDGTDVALQRFPMRWDNYDISDVILPSPSPSPR